MKNDLSIERYGLGTDPAKTDDEEVPPSTAEAKSTEGGTRESAKEITTCRPEPSQPSPSPSPS